jgi:hypothetical protein
MTMRHFNRSARGGALAVLVAAALLLPACNPVEKESDAISQLILESLTGTTMEGSDANYLQSDVLYQNPDTGETTIIADVATATFSARQLDPNPILGPSSFADITVTSYAVTYFRADGRNVEGVDIPYGFGGQVSIRVPVGVSTPLGFIVVRESAKQEPPLVNILQAGTRAEVLAMTARIDFYGHDGSNKKVKATGYLPIYFANYANE